MNVVQPALVIRDVVGTKITNDGHHVLMLVTAAEGAQLEIAFEIQAVAQLIPGIALEMENAAKTSGDGRLPAFDATWFEFGEATSNPDDKVLALQFANGGKVRFVLPRGMDSNMCDVLQVLTGRGTANAPDETVN
jgi:hypothetical protein